MNKGKELLVGLFIMMSIISLIAFLFIFDKVNIENKFYTLNVEFNDVGSLEVGTPVILGGVKIGKVKTIYLKDGKVIVEAEIRNTVKIRKGAKITILIKGLIGDLVLGVINTSDENDFYDDNATVKGEDPVSMNSLLEKTYKMLESMEFLQEKLESISFEDTTKIVNNLSQTSKKLNETLDSTKKLTQSANNLIKENEKSFNLFLNNSNLLISRLDILIGQRDKDLETIIIMIKELLLTMKSILNENEKDIKKVINNFGKISERTLNLLENLDEKELKNFYEDLKNISKEIGEITEEVKKQITGESSEELKKSIKNSKEITNKINKILDIKFEGSGEIEFDENLKADINLELKIKKEDYYIKLREELLNEKIGITSFIFGKNINKSNLGLGIIKEKAGLEYNYKLDPKWDFTVNYYDTVNQNVTLGTAFLVKRYKIYFKYNIESIKKDTKTNLKFGIGYKF